MSNGTPVDTTSIPPLNLLDTRTTENQKTMDDSSTVEERRTRSRFKQAVLQELNSQLQVKAQQIRLHLRSEPWMPADENRPNWVDNAAVDFKIKDTSEQQQLQHGVPMSIHVVGESGDNGDARLDHVQVERGLGNDLIISPTSVVRGRQIVPSKNWIGKDSKAATRLPVAKLAIIHSQMLTYFKIGIQM